MQATVLHPTSSICIDDSPGAFRFVHLLEPCFEHVEPPGRALSPTSLTTALPVSTRAPPASTSTYTSLPVHSPPPSISASLLPVCDVPRSAAPVVHPHPPTLPATSPVVTPAVSTPSTPLRKPSSHRVGHAHIHREARFQPYPGRHVNIFAFDTSISTVFGCISLT